MKIKYPGSVHNHSEYSNLRLRDSINRTSDMIDYAIELGHEVIAITEHESISNAIKVEKYYNKIKKDHPNFKVILGNEIYLCRDGLDGQNFNKEEDKYFHFILLAKDAIGHKQIREISTRAWMRSYMTGKMRRVPTYYQDLFDIDSEVLNHIMKIARELAKKLEEKLGCEGVTIIQNNGISQDVKHFHLHLVPKYNDNNKLDIEDVFHKIVD